MIRRFLKRHGWKYLPGIFFLVLCSYIQTLAPKALGEAIDLLRLPDLDRAAIFQQIRFILYIAVGVFATRFAWRYFIIGNARTMECFMRRELFAHLQRMPVDYFNHIKTGDLIAYAINDVGAVRMTFGPALAQTVNAVGTGLFSILSMAGSIHPRLTLLALAPIPFAIAAILLIGSQVRRKFRRVQELFGDISGTINENINGMRVLKAYAQEDARLKAFTLQSEQMRDANLDLTATSSLLNPLIQIFFGLSAMLSLIYGGMLTQSGAISVGDFTAFFSYLTLMMAPVMAIGRIVNLLQRGLASMRRLNSLLEQPTIPLMEEGEAEPPLQGNLSVRHLTFSYPRGDRNVLTDVSFELPQGKLLGVTGVTGSGKSTLLYLLLKFYCAPEGTIFIDGRDIRGLPARAVRELVGYVPQDGFLFNTTVEENIRFFNRALSYEELIAAARDAGLAGDVEGFPQGYQTPTGERGNHLSGGQQQRLAIARALALDPRILILDDSLSAVDTQTEHAILSRLRERLKGRTAIIVAHRLSALEHCDEILVLDGGRVAERGDHASLIRLDGRYAQLYRQQHERKEAAHE